MAIDHDTPKLAFYTKDPSALCRGHDGEDEPDNEIARDLQGRKHVDQLDNADGVYWLQQDTRSSYLVFPVPGRASADAFRTFLRERLPSSLIKDEYGYVTPIEHISNNHLSTLQAQLWLNKLEEDVNTLPSATALEMLVKNCGPFVQHGSSAMSPPADDDTRAENTMLVARYVQFIIDLLKSNHIFIHFKDSKLACEYPACKTISSSQSQSLSPMLVTLEPLIHWGTITPATDVLLCRGRIMAFRRDGEKCEDPMWTQTVTRYTPQHATSYCVNCLEMLMNKAPEIMALGRKEATCFTAVNTQSPERAATNHLKSSDVYGQTGNRALDLPSGTEASHTVMADDEWKAASGILSDRALITSLSLDGACDAPAIENIEAQYANYASDSDTTTTSPSSNKTSTCNASSDSSRNSSSPVMQGSRNLHESFTQMITMLHQGVTMPGVQYGTSTWATVNDLPSSPVSSSNDRVNHCADTQPTPNLFKSGSKNKLLEGSESHKVFFKTGAANTASTPRQGTIRKFGREIDPNTIIGPRSKFDGTFHDRSMYCEDPDEAEEIREFIKSALQTPPRQKEDAKIKSPSTTAPDHLPEYMSDENWDSTDTEGPGIWEDYILHATKDDASPPRKVKVPPKKRTPPHIKNGKQTAAPKESATGPFFAKRTLMDCPDTISPPTWVAYETRSPSASEIICSCRKPAHTSDLMIAQCSNRDCTIVWYHYDCLDKSGKISCRHGKLICQFCKNETHFRIHDADHGWTVENMVENEVKMPFTGVEMVATMPGQGGGYGIVNPYGLGDGGEEQDLIGPSVYAQGALGALGMLGYEDSSPFMVTEAYKNKHAYAKLREKAAAEEETVADGENEDEDEYYEYEGEYYEEEEQFDEEFAEDRETMNVD